MAKKMIRGTGKKKPKAKKKPNPKKTIVDNVRLLPKKKRDKMFAGTKTEKVYKARTAKPKGKPRKVGTKVKKRYKR